MNILAFDAVVLAGLAERGRDALAELLEAPVFGLGPTTSRVCNDPRPEPNPIPHWPLSPLRGLSGSAQADGWADDQPTD
jgi:hypothetical protein